MAHSNKALKVVRRSAVRTANFLKRVLYKLWEGIRYVWNRPLIVSGILLILAIFLLNLLITQTFKPYANCAYLLGNRLAMPAFFCEGYDVKVLSSTIFSIPGLRSVMDPPLELGRKVITWSIVVFFAFLSLYITLIINNLKTVVKLLTFNKEVWKNFMAGVRVWLLVFVSFCVLFYFTIL